MVGLPAVSDVRSTLVVLVRAVRKENVSFLAAAVAYYAFVSLVPLLLLGIAIGTTVGGERLATTAVAAVGDLLAPAGEETLRDAIVGGEGRGEATVLSVALLLWSGLRLFRGLDTAFSLVYGVSVTESLATQLTDAVVVLLSIAVSVGAVVAIGGVVPALLPQPGGELLAAVSLPIALTVAFLPVYYSFPDTDVAVTEALPGAVVAAVAWSTLVGVFRIYAANAGQYELYGVLGGVLLLVTWLYLAATVIILGAILNAVLAGQFEEGEGALDDPELVPDGGSEGGRDGGPGPDGTAGDDEAVDALAEDVDELEDALAALSDETADIQAQLTELEGELSAHAGDRAARDEALEETLESEVDELRDEVAAVRERLEEKTLHRDEVERDLRRYVRARLRRGHARGWGPYLVLLYGTALTLGGFHFLDGGWAVAAMLVVWLSTLGLYVVMLVVGAGLRAAGVPGRAYDWVSDRRN